MADGDELAEYLRQQADELAGKSGAEGESGPSEGSGTGAPDKEGSDPAFLDVNGTRVAVADVEELLKFQAWARANREKMDAFDLYLQGQADFVPKGQQQQPAEAEADDEDEVPASVKNELAQTRQILDAHERQIAAEALRAANKAVAKVKDEFATEFVLSETQVDELEQLTAQSGQLHITKAKYPGDQERAIREAMETVYWSSDKFRAEAIKRQAEDLATGARRELAGKVGGVAGSQGRGVSSTTGTPDGGATMSPQERRTAMAAEIAEAMKGSM